jgi:hypothetical protein
VPQLKVRGDSKSIASHKDQRGPTTEKVRVYRLLEHERLSAFDSLSGAFRDVPRPSAFARIWLSLY